MTRVPDGMSEKLAKIGTANQELENSWRSYDFATVTIKVLQLRNECDETLKWAEEKAKELKK